MLVRIYRLDSFGSDYGWLKHDVMLTEKDGCEQIAGFNGEVVYGCIVESENESMRFVNQVLEVLSGSNTVHSMLDFAEKFYQYPFRVLQKHNQTNECPTCKLFTEKIPDYRCRACTSEMLKQC